MTLDVLSFEKTLEERFEEYKIIFCHEEKPLPVSEINYVWSCVVELTVEPSGWQALWKVSRLTCKNYGIKFPSLMFVKVKKVIPESLSAVVTILAVQDDINLPELLEVPLIHLFPTVHQEDDSLLLTHTAECLDQLRYFYNHLWMPWDEEDDTKSCLDWFWGHLRQRINIYKDMQNGTLNEMEVEYVKVLLNKINNLAEKIAALEEGTVFDDSVFDLDDDSVLDLDEDNTGTCELIDHHSQLDKYKKEIEALENPHIRKMYLLKKLEPVCKRRKEIYSKLVLIVWLGGPYDELMTILCGVQKFIDEDAFVKPATLSDAIHEATTGDMILLCPGVHLIEEHGKFLKNCSIRGYCENAQGKGCVVACSQQIDALIDWNGLVLELEDITLSGDKVRSLGIVRHGLMKFHGCVLEATNRRKTDGILILDGGRAEFYNCQFIGLRIGIIAQPGAAVLMNDCTIRNCEFGIQASDESHITLENCKITKCENYGFEIRRSKQFDDQENETGPLNLLDKFQGFSFTNSTVEASAKGDVLLVTEGSYSSSELLESSNSTACESIIILSDTNSENTSSGTIVLS